MKLSELVHIEKPRLRRLIDSQTDKPWGWMCTVDGKPGAGTGKTPLDAYKDYWRRFYGA